MFDMLPWCILVACALSPSRAGQAVLFARVNILEGLQILFGLLSAQMAKPFIGAAIAALILACVARFKVDIQETKEGAVRWTFDRCLDACAYMLTPYLLIASVSLILEQVGVRWSFLPHRPFRGTGVYLFFRLALAFGWSFCLYCYLVKKLWTGVETAAIQSESI